MTRLLLDTTFLIDRERGAVGLDKVIDDDDDVAIAAVTVAELRVGVALASADRADARAAFVDEVVATIPVIGYDLAVAERHGELLVAVRREGAPRGAHDLIIAATASASDRTLVSTDRTAFDGLPGVTVRAHR